jgi:PleD family two-component response regulator
MTLSTAADLARFCRVDLKTIHNWVGKNAIAHHRTAGRHLRFHRLDVIDFLRVYGYAIPDELRGSSPRVVLACRESQVTAAVKRALARRMEIIGYEDAFDALVALSTVAPEALALDVSLLEGSAARCIARLRTNEATRHIRVVAIGDHLEARAGFLAAGASAYVASADPAELREALERVVAID